MKRFILLAPLALLGCGPTGPGYGEAFLSKTKIAEKDDATCQSYGFNPNTEAYGVCRMQQADLRNQAIHSQRQGAMAGLAIIQASQPRRVMTNCTSNTFGRTTTTNCY